jgi:proteic killer suppression protein
MIRSFGNKTAEHLFHGKASKETRKLPVNLHAKARRQLDQINAAVELADLKVPPGNKLEALKGDLAAYHSIRINDQWRIIFIG